LGVHGEIYPELHPVSDSSIQPVEHWRVAVRQLSGDNTSREFTQQEILEMVQLTETAVSKVKEILGSQEPKPAGLRIAVVGGGCSGFSYSMAFENTPNMLDKTYKFDDLKVFIDQASLLYLDGAEVDYVETMEGSGFKFNNPNVKSTCGCGSSFSA
jgi:iron-sulfur cluster assembly accessory protein